MFREGHKPVQPGDFPDNRLQGVFHFLARQGDGPFVVERDFDPPVGVGGLRGCGADGKSVSIQSGHSDGCRRIEEEARGRNQKEDREAECKLARLQQRCHGEKDDDACRNPHDNPAWNEQRPISGSSRSRLPVGHQIRSHSQKRSAKKEKRDGRGHNGQNGQRDQDGMSARLFRCCGRFRVFGVFRGRIHRLFRGRSQDPGVISHTFPQFRETPLRAAHPRRAGGIGTAAASRGRFDSTARKTCAIIRSASGVFSQNHARWNRLCGLCALCVGDILRGLCALCVRFILRALRGLRVRFWFCGRGGLRVGARSGDSAQVDGSTGRQVEMLGACGGEVAARQWAAALATTGCRCFAARYRQVSRLFSRRLVVSLSGPMQGAGHQTKTHSAFSAFSACETPSVSLRSPAPPAGEPDSALSAFSA